MLGGNAYRWPVHFLLPLVGLAILGEATRHVKEEELADLPIANVTPPIADDVWAAYIAAVAAALARGFTGIHTLTTRGDGGLVSTMLVAEQAGLPVRVRIERFDGAVLALDVVIGREIDEVRGATFTLWAVPARALGINPAGPPAAPLCKTGDAEVDVRFRLRGSANRVPRAVRRPPARARRGAARRLARVLGARRPALSRLSRARLAARAAAAAVRARERTRGAAGAPGRARRAARRGRRARHRRDHEHAAADELGHATDPEAS